MEASQFMSKQVRYSYRKGVIKQKIYLTKRNLLSAAAAVGLLASMGSALAASSNSLPFSSSGSGTETSLSALGCQFTVAGCTVESNGTATSSHMGTGPYQSTLTVNWADAYSNGDGGFCAPASGSGSITAANGNTVELSSSGTVCEVGATGSNVPHTFSGTYTITNGTGRFSGASGSGTETGGDNGYGSSNYTLSGTIIY